MAKICILSYEYPPETAYGGISAYTEQIAELLVNHNHEVHVFCGSTAGSQVISSNGVTIHRIYEPNRAHFPQTLVSFLEEEHQKAPFELLECPEFGAEGLEFADLHPKLPVLVRLHTPLFLIFLMNSGNFRYVDESWFERFRFFIKQMVRVANPFPPGRDREYLMVKRATYSLSPSASLRRLMIRHWHLPGKKILHVPYPYKPSGSLLEIPVINRPARVIGFFGRLEIRKGVHLLPAVINSILSRYPDIVFHFNGQAMESPEEGIAMDVYLKSRLDPKISNRVIFRVLKYNEIQAAYAETDICIYPSIWENFPLVCLEAMSAGRAIIGSKRGGMADMISNGNTGFLTEPINIRKIEKLLVRLISDDNLRVSLGRAARDRILNLYGSEKFNTDLVALYERTIKTQ